VRLVRVWCALRASLAGLAAGYFASLIAALWLRASTSGADLVWKVISPFKLASWILGSAHAVPLVVRSEAGLDAPQSPGTVGGLGQVLGREDVVFSFSVLLVPISILAVTGIAVALLVRWSRPETTRQLLVWSGVAAATHGGVLAVLTATSRVQIEFEGVVAPDLGLGSAATGHLGFSIGHPPLFAFAIGAVLGAAFAVAGGLSSRTLRTTLASDSRVVLLGWMHGLGTAAGVVAAVLALGAIVALITGKAPAFGLLALGTYTLLANAIAAGIVLAHGVSMHVALDAGPLTGWERMDLLNFSTGGGAPLPLLLGALIPLAAGVIAGRFCRRRSDLSQPSIAWRFGGLWGLTLALLALLLRVRVLSSFSVGSLDLGGGGAAFDPLIALTLGFIWGCATSYIGARTIRVPTPGPSEDAALTWECAECGITNASDDYFCVSCGTVRTTAGRLGPG
jgi:hypothetical protein